MQERIIIKDKTIMWSKIKMLKEDKGYSNSKIARLLGIHRQTVAKYLSMNESEYFRWLTSIKRRRGKLDVYMSSVKGLLEGGCHSFVCGNSRSFERKISGHGQSKR